MLPKSKKNNSDKHWTLAYIFTKLGDNLANNDRDILIDISHSTYETYIALSASSLSGLNKASIRET